MNQIGLTSTEATQKLRQFGYNELQESNKISPLQILLRQVKKNYVIYLLFVTALVSLFLGKPLTTYVIFGVISLVIITGFIQEYKAENAIQALKQMIMSMSRVFRNGKEQEIQSREIVPSDTLILRTGERIPADCIIVDATNLTVNESVLTGESIEVKKRETTLHETDNEEHLLFMGTFIVSGKCTARVLHTGMNTRFGKIAKMISSSEKKMPLQDKVNNISKYMVIVGLTSSFLTGLILFFRADTLTAPVIIDILILVVALCVSAFPEGFPVVLTTTLAAGVNRMAKQNAIINKMSIIETLGETTVICSDKTGTLTKGEMTVKHIVVNKKTYDVTGIGYQTKGEIMDGEKAVHANHNIPLHYLVTAAVLCNDSSIEKIEEDTYKVLGSSTEGSLLILGAKTGIFKDDYKSTRTEEMPFSSERKMMSVSYKNPHGHIIFAKGAIELLLQRCSSIQTTTGIKPLTTEEKEVILSSNKEMTSKAFRTLGFAYKLDKSTTTNYSEDDLVFLGLTAMEDPPREEVKDAIVTCLQAGIKVKMITGDNKETATAIAHQIGLSGEVLEGKMIDAMSDEELSKVVTNTAIFARVRPEHKLRIVKALKNNNEIVTMTGDGVNDAPALKEAHIGVAMGINGTDVSRSVADITLRDDNFATIVVAIKEGRTIFNNIRKFMTYQLSCNLAEIVILFIGVLLAPLFGWFVPIVTALQILFMNLVTDNLPAITLGFNPSSKDIMLEKPRKKTQLLTKEFVRLVIFNGLFMGLMATTVLYLVYNVLKYPTALAQTTVLVSMILLDNFGAYNFRSFRFKTLNRHVFANKYLALASLFSLTATLIVVYSPLNTLFETVPLGIEQWMIAFGSGVFMWFVFDILKTINNKTHKLLPHTT